MDNSPATKSCLMCAETIKAAAKICPFCQSRQGRFPPIKNDLAAFVVALFTVAVLVAALIIGIRYFDNKGRDFDTYREDLIVLQSSLKPTAAFFAFTNLPALTNVSDTSTNRHRPFAYPEDNFCLTGTVTNRSPYPWRIHAFEARFFYPSNNLLEAQQPYLREPFTILPHQEHPFRLSFYTRAFPNLDPLAQVRVLMAEDPARSK